MQGQNEFPSVSGLGVQPHRTSRQDALVIGSEDHGVSSLPTPYQIWPGHTAVVELPKFGRGDGQAHGSFWRLIHEKGTPSGSSIFRCPRRKSSKRVPVSVFQYAQYAHRSIMHTRCSGIQMISRLANKHFDKPSLWSP